MSDNKPKIDLKSRLGKKTVSSPSGPSIPPPVGLSRPGAVPPPPFGRTVPPVDASNPYSAIDAGSAPARVEPQAIKVEMSEEVRHEQKKQSKKALVLTGIMSLVGLIVGFMIGGANERSNVASQALKDAEELAKEIRGSYEAAETLADTLKSARERLSSQKFPEEEINKLGDLRIPFGGDKLGGRNIGRFRKEVSSGLLAYASASEKANEQIETVQRVTRGARKFIEEMFAQGTNPKIQWAAVADNGSGGPWLTMLGIPEPFAAKAEKGWPESVKFKIGGKDVSVKRYTKGDVLATDPLFIPIDPTTQGTVCPADTAFRVARQIQDLENLLRGVKEEGGHEENGIIDDGRALEEKLKQIGRPG